MAITVQYAPNAALLGQAANQAGYGQYAQSQERFGESIRQFDESLDERQRQFDASFGEQQRQFDANQGFRRDAMGLQANQFNAGLYDRGVSRQYDYLQNALQRQYGAESQMFDANARMASQRMQAEANQAYQERQHQNVLAQQVQGQRTALLAKQMDADWSAIQKQWGRLDESQQQELVGRFQDRYAASGMPMPMEMPFQEAKQDPNATVVDTVRAQGHPVVIDPETGQPSLMRGYSPEMNPEYMRKKAEYEKEMAEIAHQNEMKLEAAKQQSKAPSDEEVQAKQAEAAEKARIAALDRQQKFIDMRAKQLEQIIKVGTITEKGIKSDKVTMTPEAKRAMTELERLSEMSNGLAKEYGIEFPSGEQPAPEQQPQQQSPPEVNPTVFDLETINNGASLLDLGNRGEVTYGQILIFRQPVGSLRRMRLEK